MFRKGVKHLYQKLFGIYSLIMISAVLTLMLFSIQLISGRLLETDLDYLNMMQEKAFSYLELCEQETSTFHAELVQAGDVIEDLLFYLRNEGEEYQKFRLNRYAGSSSLAYQGFNNFAKNALDANEGITAIYFYSYAKRDLTTCVPDKSYYKRRLSIKEEEDIRQGNFAKDGSFSFLKEIRDPDTLENVGFLSLSFDATPFLLFQEYYKKADLLVMDGMGSVIASSFTDPHSIWKAEIDGGAEKTTASYIVRNGSKNYQILSFLKKTEAGKLPLRFLLTIVCIGILIIGVGEVLIYWYLIKLSSRLAYILDGMERLSFGDLNVRFRVDEKGDELDVIASNFNEMCERLKHYIEKSYLSEIAQRDAEMEVLQNQINPHFLYNTLEAIRMKAICNKDRDVAKMLYSMAVIFRSQLKDDNQITMVQELHYCKKYLELFQYRYQNKFSFDIDCPEEWMNYSVIKFIVQPILENYFAHGIYGEREGNRVQVRVEKEEHGMCIHIMDNGIGMQPEEMERMNKVLQANSETSRKSIGLLNVNRRIKAVYGSEFGVVLTPNMGGGLHVKLKVGEDENNGMEESVTD